MSCFRWAIFATGMFASFALHVAGQEVSDPKPAEANLDEQVHDELRVLRERMFAAYEKRDLDALLKDCAENIVITWQNGDRNFGRDEFRAFYTEMMSGDNAIVKDISTTFKVDDTSILYGEDTAVARGTVDDRFILTSGSEFLLSSKWTATVVKVDDSWKVASFHISANIFDNPILNKAKQSLVFASGIGALCGIALGALIVWLMRKRTSK